MSKAFTAGETIDDLQKSLQILNSKGNSLIILNNFDKGLPIVIDYACEALPGEEEIPDKVITLDFKLSIKISLWTM